MSQKISDECGASERVARGGSFDGGARYCRSAYRDGGSPGDRYWRLGFRPTITIDLSYSSTSNKMLLSEQC